MTTVKPKPYDPLNRIEPEGKLPYGHPDVTSADLEASWRREYASQVAGLDDARLLGDLPGAEADVAACADAIERAWHDEHRIDLNLETRLIRLRGRRDAIVAELARRSGT